MLRCVARMSPAFPCAFTSTAATRPAAADTAALAAAIGISVRPSSASRRLPVRWASRSAPIATGMRAIGKCTSEGCSSFRRGAMRAGLGPRVEARLPGKSGTSNAPGAGPEGGPRPGGSAAGRAPAVRLPGRGRVGCGRVGRAEVDRAGERPRAALRVPGAARGSEHPQQPLVEPRRVAHVGQAQPAQVLPRHAPYVGRRDRAQLVDERRPRAASRRGRAGRGRGSWPGRRWSRCRGSTR
jgi:hypothetical protein